MFKKLTALMLIALSVMLAGCSIDPPAADKTSSGSSVKTEIQKGEEILNPLTGTEISADKAAKRPVAIMINNIGIAQPVQTGVNKADIVYETEVEGGITRLMAVYQDISSVGQIGPVRSARYPYVDLALGNNAVYVHCGQDNLYCKPHLKDIDDQSIDTGVLGSQRIKNGLAKEHTLYAMSESLYSGLSGKFDMTAKKTGTWQQFAEKDKIISLSDGAANVVTVPFSTSCKATFTFDDASKTYVRSVNGTVRKDYKTGETTSITNILVLNTSISFYPDNYHRKVDLQSGDGYYITNGTYQKINWSKGAAANAFTFTDAEGNKITLNRGRTWVCIPDKQKVATTFS